MGLNMYYWMHVMGCNLFTLCNVSLSKIAISSEEMLGVDTLSNSLLQPRHRSRTANLPNAYWLLENILLYIRFWLVILFSPFGFIAPKNLNYLAFKSFDFERTRWRLFQKRVVRTKFDIYIFIITLTRINISYVQNLLVIVDSTGTLVRDIQIFDS